MLKFYTVDDEIIITNEEQSVGTELVANTTDGAYEKHVPVIEHNGDSVVVKVGSVAHPMMDVH